MLSNINTVDKLQFLSFIWHIDRQNLSKGCWDITMYHFLKMAAVSHLGSVGHILIRVLGGFYHFAKFGLNHCSSFNSTKVWILFFCMFCLKMPVHTQKMTVFGHLIHKMGCNIDLTPKGLSLHRKFMPQKWEFRGHLILKMGCNINVTLKRYFLCRNTAYNIYTVSKKNDNDVAHYNFNAH